MSGVCKYGVVMKMAIGMAVLTAFRAQIDMAYVSDDACTIASCARKAVIPVILLAIVITTAILTKNM